jgi:hypothetical protein
MPAVRISELDDERHNDEIDRMDAVRFRQLVKYALRKDVWLSRMAESPVGHPTTLAEVRVMLDYVIQMENLR